MKHKPAYELHCTNCRYEGKFYFDVPVPTACPKCARMTVKRQCLQTGAGYVHKRRTY